MSDLLRDPPTGKPVGALRLRGLARRARTLQLSGHALIGISIALTVLGAAFLLWTNATGGVTRVVLLLAAAGLIRLRLLTSRLGAMMPADGLRAASTQSTWRRWLDLAQEAVLLLAAGSAAWGARAGPLMGVLAAVLLLVVGWRRRARPAVQIPSRPDVTTVIAVVCLLSVAEPLWGGKGQAMLIGLYLTAAVLAVQVVRLPRRTATMDVG